ncbi:MAG: hypothetical protein LBR68_02400 [Lachnoclostridium sp.]|jgi:hypothetical protein|nr:hypothetical protein [Lachnoclostridium sp.]
MNDIFYLLEKDVKSEDICEVLKDNKDVKIYINKDGSAFTVEYMDKIHTEWYKISIDEFEYIASHGNIETIYCISHHSKYISYLIPEIKKILTRFGGLIGNDNEDCKPLFSSDNIHDFTYE